MKAYYDSPFGCLEFVFDGDQLCELNIASEKPAFPDELSDLQKNVVQQLIEYLKKQWADCLITKEMLVFSPTSNYMLTCIIKT